MMEVIKKFLKTKQAKISLAVVCIAAVLTAAFLLQPSPNHSVSVADGSVVTSSESSTVASSSISSSEGRGDESDRGEGLSGTSVSSMVESSTEQSVSDSSNTAVSKVPVSSSQGMEIDPDTGKDKYQTDPVPEGKPTPVEPEDTVVNEEKELTCTLSIRCDTILNNMGMLKEEKKAVVPGDGVILKTTTVTFNEGESVFDVLKRITRERRIQMEFEFTAIYNSAYIEGIHNLYEFDCGDLSGWMYKVNGWFPNYGCSRYQLKQGDIIEWVYTCDLGKDVGGGYAAGGQGDSE